MWLHAEIRTLADIPRHWASVAPGKTALADARRTLTYAQLDDRASQIAGAIAAAGITPGSHIGFLGKNCVEFFEVWFGAARAGCALAPLNWRSAGAELTELVKDARIPLLVASVEFAEAAHRVGDAASADVVVCGAAGPGSLDEWLDRFSGPDRAITVHESDTALLAYTSGTTGRPKGARLSHRAFGNWFLISSLEPTETWQDTDVMLMVMPNFHLAGSWVSVTALYHGGSIAMLPAFEPSAMLEAIDRYRPTIACLVPTAITMLLEHPGIAGHDFSSLRRLLYAGSPIGPETLRRAISTFGCELTQFYGTSETFIITLLRPEQHDPDDPQILTSCGEPVPLVDVRIVDAEGAEVPAGAIGEVLVRSPLMFSGYWNQPEATAAVLTGGWYHTGDLGRRDDAGRLYLVDRLKDMIVTGGENVYTVEVEGALARHPAVAAVAVVGAPDPRWGERIVAYVIPAAGAPVTAGELAEHCRSLIAGYKVPKQIHLVETLPMTASGKIRKSVLRERLAAEPAPSQA